jgi:methylated-DNA-[protein]-cysteine S-methyltransferase
MTTATSLAIASPLGTLVAVAERDELVALALPDRPVLAATAVTKPRGVLAETARQLAEYFAGRRQAFDLPLAPRGTGFQERVWRALLAIPFGATCSYRDIAASIGRPAACRAVGAANGKNPIAIIVPCHRVIGADRSLTGYGGGLPAKRWLLSHEGAQALLLAG